jgi:methionine synthase I (cobalamin-dependent)
MKTLIRQLLAHAPIITDGAWGTELQSRGLAIGEFPDAWNLTCSERVLEVARSYVEAGSQIILTNTFGANRIRLSEAGLEKSVLEINREGVRISKAAAWGEALVFASIGPSGKLLAAGDINPADLLAAFREQAQALASAGADALVVETMSDLDEAKIALQAAVETGIPVVVCMVFDTGLEFDRTMMGHAPEQAAELLAEAGADMIGMNCGQGVETSVSICRRLRSATGLPIWIKPNAGLPQLITGQARYLTTPHTFSSFIPALLQAGASFLGGCCGTSPEFIRTIKSCLRPQQGALGKVECTSNC